MTGHEMLEEARRAVEALEAQGFLLMASRAGTSFYIEAPDTPLAIDQNGHDARDRFHERLKADLAFRAAVKAFILAERPYGGAV